MEFMGLVHSFWYVQNGKQENENERRIRMLRGFTASYSILILQTPTSIALSLLLI